MIVEIGIRTCRRMGIGRCMGQVGIICVDTVEDVPSPASLSTDENLESGRWAMGDGGGRGVVQPMGRRRRARTEGKSKCPTHMRGPELVVSV